MLYVPTEFLDRCGVIISVANAFVEYKAEVYNLSLSEGSVGTDEWNKLLFAQDVYKRQDTITAAIAI